MSNQIYNAGRVAMVYQGDWSSEQLYYMLDVVAYGGDTYCMYKPLDPGDVIEKPDIDTDHWFKMANKGRDLSLTNVVDTHDDLIAATAQNGDLYLVKNDQPLLTDPMEHNVLYLKSEEWLKIGELQQPAKSIYAGYGNPISGLSDEKYFYIEDLYLDYSTSTLWQCNTNGDKQTSNWTNLGRLSGISSSIRGKITLIADNWIDKGSYYQYESEQIQSLNYEDTPIVGLDSSEAQSVEALNQWNYIYKVETVPVASNGSKLVFYASTQPDQNLKVYYVGYNLTGQDVYASWSNPKVAINYTTESQPSAYAALKDNSVNFNFEIPQEKFQINNIETAPPGEAAASIEKLNNGAWGLNLAIPRSNGEGMPGEPASLESFSLAYLQNQDGQTVPDDEAEWSETIPVLRDNWFLWTRTTLYFNSGIPAKIYTVSKQGGVEGAGLSQVVAAGGQGITVSGSPYTEDSEVPLTIAHADALNTVPAPGVYKLTINKMGHIVAVAQAEPNDVNAPNKPIPYTDGQITVAAWNSSTSCTITLADKDITSNSIIFITPNGNDTNRRNWGASNVRCSGQGTNTLTFSCTKTPTAQLTFDYMVWNL